MTQYDNIALSSCRYAACPPPDSSCAAVRRRRREGTEVAAILLVLVLSSCEVLVQSERREYRAVLNSTSEGVATHVVIIFHTCLILGNML